MIRTYNIDELVEISGVTRRTISDYIAKGVLAGPSHRGRGATYSQSDVDVLRLVPRVRTLMKKQFRDLNDVAAFLQQLSQRELSWLASRSSEKALVGAIRRLRVRIQLAGLLPMVAPERIEEVLDNLTPAQIRSIDTDRYPIGAVIDLTDLLNENHAAAEVFSGTRGKNNGNGHSHPHATDPSSGSWSVSWLNGGIADVPPPADTPQPDDVGSLEDVLHHLEDQVGGTSSSTSTAERPAQRSVDTRLRDIAQRVERLERLLQS